MRQTTPRLAAWLTAAGLMTLGACQNSEPPRIGTFEHNGAGGPPTRSLVEGTGRFVHLAWQATADGVIYIYDQDLDVIVYEGRIHKGETVGVDPARNKITFDGNPVALSDYKRDIIPGNRHRIMFLPKDQEK